MPINNGPLHAGDWIQATNSDGALIEGQALHTTDLGRLSIIEVAFNRSEKCLINVNFWDVDILKRNVAANHTPATEEELRFAKGL